MKNINRILFCLCIGIHLPLIHGSELKNEKIVQVASDLKSNDPKIKQAAFSLLSDRKTTITKLIQILQDEKTKKETPEVVGAAIEILGEMKAEESVDLLAEMLLFHPGLGRNFTNQDSTKVIGGDTYGHFHCPAWRSLGKIGNASINAFLENLIKGNEDYLDYGSVLGSNIFAEVFKLNIQDSNDAINRFQKTHNLDKKSIERVEFFKKYLKESFLRIKENNKKAEAERALKEKAESKNPGS